MATSNNGILGVFRGTIGPVTAYTRNGQNIFRSSHSRITKKQNDLQKSQTEKIKICNRFTRCFTGTGFYNKSFPAYGSTGNSYNRATSALLNQAVCGVYPNQYLSYPLVMVSKGRLPGAVNAAAAEVGDGIIKFTFENNSGNGSALPTDTVLLVAYAEALNQAVFTLDGGLRKDGKAVLEVPFFKGYAAETWIGFLNKTATDASNSFYTGKLQL